jgi:hypothetical protein
MTKLPANASALALALAVAAFAAPALADTVTYSSDDRVTIYDVDPVTRTYVERQTVIYNRDGTVSAVYSPSSPAPASPPLRSADPAGEVTYVAPQIDVAAPRGSRDQLITEDVADRIANDPAVSGRVGVETYRSDVTLTGRVTSPAQADRAASDARSVPGVRDVNNELRTRVGNF